MDGSGRMQDPQSPVTVDVHVIDGDIIAGEDVNIPVGSVLQAHPVHEDVGAVLDRQQPRPASIRGARLEPVVCGAVVPTLGTQFARVWRGHVVARHTCMRALTCG